MLALGAVVYASVAGDRLRPLVAAVGAAGCALLLVALVFRRPSLLAFGLACVGASYGVFLSLRAGSVDSGAAAVAAAVFAAAELGFWSLEPQAARWRGPPLLRRVGGVAAGAAVAALVGAALLTLASGVGGGVALEAAGVAAAALALGAIAWLAARAAT